MANQGTKNEKKSSEGNMMIKQSLSVWWRTFLRDSGIAKKDMTQTPPAVEEVIRKVKRLSMMKDAKE